MGRSLKVGLDYFRLDVNLDEKFELIEAEFGLTGFAVVVRLYQRIYGGAGYYCEWDDEVALVFGSRNKLGANVVSEIVKAAIKRKLFDRNLFEKYGILTSTGIQKWYFEAVSRREQVEVIREYLLIPAAILPKNVNINRISVDRNRVSVDRNPHSKGEESRGKESRGGGSGNKEYRDPFGAAAAPPMTDELVAYASNNLTYLSPRNMEELLSFRDSLPDALIQHAIDEACAAGVRRYNYVRSILNRYIEQGFRSVGEVEAHETTRQKGAQEQRAYADEDDFY